MEAIAVGNSIALHAVFLFLFCLFFFCFFCFLFFFFFVFCFCFFFVLFSCCKLDCVAGRAKVHDLPFREQQQLVDHLKQTHHEISKHSCLPRFSPSSAVGRSNFLSESDALIFGCFYSLTRRKEGKIER